MFNVAHAPAVNMIQSTMSGFLFLADVERYTAKVEPLILAAAAQNRSYLMLLDVSCCCIQSQEVVASFQEHVRRMPPARRIAVVTGDSSIRMQVKRIMEGPAMLMFDERSDALEWLLGNC